MTSTPSLPGPDDILRYIEQQLDRAEAALRDNQPDQLTTETEALGRGIALFQQVFQQMKDGTAAEWQPKLTATNSRLDSLQQQLLARSVPELPDWFLNRPKQGVRFPFQLWLDDPASPLTLRLPPTPAGIDLAPWYRRWSLMVLRHWLEAHLGLSLSTVSRP